VVVRMKLIIVCLAAPSFHEGSGSAAFSDVVDKVQSVMTKIEKKMFLRYFTQTP